MSKSFRISLLFACLLAPLGLPALAAGSDTAASAELPVLVSPEEQDQCLAEEPSAPDTSQLDLSTEPVESDAVCSPPPQCFRDRDCDRICGKRLGVCVRVNSCYNECICSVS